MRDSTRFSIAIPLGNIKANTIIKALTILVLLCWVFLKQLSQMRIKLCVSFISENYASLRLNTHTPEKYDENTLLRQSKR